MLNFVCAKYFTCTETFLCSQARIVIWKWKCSSAFQGSKPKALRGAVCDLSFKTVHFGCRSSANLKISEVFRVLGGYAEVSALILILFQLQCTVNLMWTPQNMCGAHARKKKNTSCSTTNTVHLEFHKSAYYFSLWFCFRLWPLCVEFASSPHACVGSLQVLWHPPVVQKHAR